MPIGVGGRGTACAVIACSGQCRSAACSKARPIAESVGCMVSTPTTAGPNTFSLRPRTTATGQCACVATCIPTEPSSSPPKPPRPRWPTTSRLASSATFSRTGAGSPSSTEQSTSTCGAAARATATASVAIPPERSSAAAVNSPTVPYHRPGTCQWQATTTRSGRRPRSAAPAAQRTAVVPCGEPSVPTTISPGVMAAPPCLLPSMARYRQFRQWLIARVSGLCGPIAASRYPHRGAAGNGPRRKGVSSPGEGEVAVAEGGQPLAVERVPAVEQVRRAHQADELGPVQLLVVVPLGHQHHGVAVVEHLGDRLAQELGELRLLAAEPPGRDRVVQLHPGAPLHEQPGDVDRGRVTQVVGLRLERQTQQAHLAALEDAQLGQQPLDHGVALAPVDLPGRLDDGHVVVVFGRGGDQG